METVTRLKMNELDELAVQRKMIQAIRDGIYGDRHRNHAEIISMVGEEARIRNLVLVMTDELEADLNRSDEI